MSDFTQGIIGDGAVVLRHGVPISIDDIVSELNVSLANKRYASYVADKVAVQALVIKQLRTALSEAIEWNWMDDGFPVSVRELIFSALSDSKMFSAEEN